MVENKKYAVIIVNSDVKKAPRVIKTIEALEVNSITPIIFSYTDRLDGCICFTLPTVVRKATHHHLPVPIRKLYSLRYLLTIWKSRLFNRWFYTDYKTVASLMKSELKPFETDTIVVIAHHMNNLPAGAILARMINKKLIFNAHEYYPEQFSGDASWTKYKEQLEWVGHNFLNHCYKLFTVCNGILRRYEHVFGLTKEQQVLITNATMYYDLLPVENEGKIKLIHHGVASVNRRLELMLEVADYADKYKFEFYFMLVPSSAHKDYFIQLTEEIEKRDNCFIIEPVPTKEIPNAINKYDLGFYVYNDDGNFNMKHYLPNKLFEFIQGRLGIVIGPYVEMKDIVREYEIGVVCEENDTKAIAKMLNEITREDVKRYKEHVSKAADELKGENEIQKMVDVFTEILKQENNNYGI